MEVPSQRNRTSMMSRTTNTKATMPMVPKARMALTKRTTKWRMVTRATTTWTTICWTRSRAPPRLTMVNTPTPFGPPDRVLWLQETPVLPCRRRLEAMSTPFRHPLSPLHLATFPCLFTKPPRALRQVIILVSMEGSCSISRQRDQHREVR